MVNPNIKQAIEATARAGGVPLDRIAAALRCLEERPPDADSRRNGVRLLNQAEKARQMGVSRFTIRKLVQAGRLHPIELLPGLWRFRAEELPSQEGGLR